jgi:uncharacterized protein YjbI with pentapeptide repeats
MNTFKKISWPISISSLIFLMMILSCQNKGLKSSASNNIESDTINIPELINFLEEDQLDSIISLDNGYVCLKGIKAVPRDSDDFRRENLDKIFWDHNKIRKADFRGASFRSARCANTDFSGSDFRAADIRWTLFDGSNLTHCNFDQSRLFHVHVNYADLSYSTFRGANMFGMEGHFAKLRHCDMTGALLKDTEFVEADFTGSKAVKAKLIRAVLKDSKLDSVDFSFADFTGGGLEGSSFKNAKLRHANFQGGHLQGADFSGADLYGCNFFGTEFESTNFNNAKNIPEPIKPFINEEGFATGIWQDMSQHK